MLDGTDGLRVQRDDVSTNAASGLDAVLERIVALVADLLDAPVAFLALRDRENAALAARVGLDASLQDVVWDFPLSEAEPHAVADAVEDLRFHRHPLVTGPPYARFYVGAPVLSPEGEVVGALCAVDDVPRAMPSTREMRRLADLAALAADALDARRVHQRAEAVAKAKSALLADVSHELRTPLNGIVGFTQLLKRDGVLDADARRSVERIEEAGRGLLTIVGDVLDLSKLEADAVRLDLRSFSATRLVEDAAAMILPEADRKGLRLLVDLPDDPVGPLLGDPDRLRQVLLNLLANAVKFTGSGIVRVGVAAGRQAVPGASVPLTFVVEDSGVGIATDGMARLFRRFAQADGSVARRFGGTGLGLAISKTLVEAMGGSIAVDSAPGAGARFSVFLALPPAIDPRVPSTDHRPAGGDDLTGLAILLAEDAPLNQKLAVQMLAPLGAEVDVVADGAAAIAALGARDYALVLMDMEMPVMDGLEATRRIRASGGASASVPIVALTANVFPEQLDLCRLAGMDDHLTKPFGPGDLAAKVLRWARRLDPAA